MNIRTTPIQGVHVVETTPFKDHRGAFARWFCKQELASILQGREIIQSNFSQTSAVGAIRGMHYQKVPHAEMKFVRCITGRVWDVAVDIRKDSPTFLHWYAEELTPERGNMLVIPEGCAHGFQVLEENSTLLYMHTAAYAPNAEGGISYLEPRVGIEWPLPVQDVSNRDTKHPFLSDAFCGITL